MLDLDSRTGSSDVVSLSNFLVFVFLVFVRGAVWTSFVRIYLLQNINNNSTLNASAINLLPS